MLRRFTTCSLCTSHRSVISLPASGGTRIYSFRVIDLCFCRAVVSAAVSSVLYLRDVAGEHTETRSGWTQQASTKGNSEHVFVLQATQETTTSKQCQKHVTDCVAMPSLQHKKLGLTLSLSANLSMVHLAASTHQPDTCAKWFPRSLNTSPQNYFTSTVVQEDRCQDNRWKYETICKEYTSYYRTLATKTVYMQQEELHEH